MQAVAECYPNLVTTPIPTCENVAFCCQLFRTGARLLISYALAYSALTHLFDSGEVPDGIFAVSDTFGAAVVRAAHTTGIEIPRDLKVVGFDNAELSTMLTPTLTTVNQPRYRMGYSACRILIDLLAGYELGSRSMVLETELIVRESTAGEAVA